MRADKESTKDVTINSIMQIVPTADQFGGELVVVAEKHSWGCVVVREREARRINWAHLEPTGGSIVFDAGGKRVAPEAPGIKHHE